MGRERFDSVTARVTGKIQSALAYDSRRREQRRLSHEQGHVPIDDIPQDQEIVLFEQARECLDTRAFNVTRSPIVGYLTPEATLRRQIAKSGYNQSVSTEESPHLRPE